MKSGLYGKILRLFELQPFAHLVCRCRPDTLDLVQVIAILKRPPPSAGRGAFTILPKLLAVNYYRLCSDHPDARQSHQTCRRCIVGIYSAFQFDCPRLIVCGDADQRKAQAKGDCYACSNNKREQLNPVHPEVPINGQRCGREISSLPRMTPSAPVPPSKARCRAGNCLLYQ
jgi:hypothetical protein